MRFDFKCTAQTAIKYYTDGVLPRETLSDPLLSRYSVIVVDEAHQRSLHSDMLLGLLKKIQRKRKELAGSASNSISSSLDLTSGGGRRHTTGPTSRSGGTDAVVEELRIVVMSATMDASTLKDFFETNVACIPECGVKS